MPLVASPGRAQELVDTALGALELTDRRIMQAQELVATADNSLAQTELGRAIEIQASAKVEFAAGHYRISYDLTLRARGHADRAIAAVRGLPDPDRVIVQLERTRDLLERARERIEECDNDRARAMLRAAFDMQARAEIAAREGRYLAALQLTMSARERALRALRLCHMEENLQENAERALHRTDEVIARAREVVADADRSRAAQVLSTAVDLQARAGVEFRAGRFEVSLRTTLNARAHAFRAIRMVRGE
jgi:hypothetical protein